MSLFFSPFESRFPINVGITGYVATTGEVCREHSWVKMVIILFNCKYYNFFFFFINQTRRSMLQRFLEIVAPILPNDDVMRDFNVLIFLSLISLVCVCG